MNNAHSDILNAEIPTDEGKKQAYLEELKMRAKGAFQTKDMVNAEKLYGKAIDCNSKDYLLYSNRCAVRLLVKKNEEALRDAKRCLNLEPTFIKAHYRKAQALQRLGKFDEAVAACKDGLTHHANNSELIKLQEEIEKEWTEDKERKEKFNSEAQEARPDLPKPEPTRIPLTKPSKPTDSTNDGSNGGGKDITNDGSNNMRGYKKTADGKTTSYFHTELSDEAKKLIGDCRPQKLDDKAIPEPQKAGVGSAWNQAGTFEQKNCTKYFHDQLRSALRDASVTLPNDLPDVILTVDSVSGDAQITCARGKVRHIYDITLELKWEFVTHDDKTGKGTIKFESDGDGDYDVDVNVDSATHSATRSIVTEFIKSSGKGIQPYILQKIRGVENEFKKMKL